MKRLKRKQLKNMYSQRVEILGKTTFDGLEAFSFDKKLVLVNSEGKTLKIKSNLGRKVSEFDQVFIIGGRPEDKHQYRVAVKLGEPGYSLNTYYVIDKTGQIVLESYNGDYGANIEGGYFVVPNSAKEKLLYKVTGEGIKLEGTYSFVSYSNGYGVYAAFICEYDGKKYYKHPDMDIEIGIRQDIKKVYEYLGNGKMIALCNEQKVFYDRKTDKCVKIYEYKHVGGRLAFRINPNSWALYDEKTGKIEEKTYGFIKEVIERDDGYVFCKTTEGDYILVTPDGKVLETNLAEPEITKDPVIEKEIARLKEIYELCKGTGIINFEEILNRIEFLNTIVGTVTRYDGTKCFLDGERNLLLEYIPTSLSISSIIDFAEHVIFPEKGEGVALLSCDSEEEKFIYGVSIGDYSKLAKGGESEHFENDKFIEILVHSKTEQLKYRIENETKDMTSKEREAFAKECMDELKAMQDKIASEKKRLKEASEKKAKDEQEIEKYKKQLEEGKKGIEKVIDELENEDE